MVFTLNEKEIIIIFIKIIIIMSFVSSQVAPYSNQYDMPYKVNINKTHSAFIPNNNHFNFSFNVNTIKNSGHPNLENNAELYAAGSSTELISSRLQLSTAWLSLSIEPYVIFQKGIFNSDSVVKAYSNVSLPTNNHNTDTYLNKIKMGFRQSRIILHYKGVGTGYGNMSHWWGPGFHSTLALSNNAPSQETYILGTFKDIRMGPFSFGSQIIVMPYESTVGAQLYFSGLKAHLSHHSKNAIITLGFHRTYLSGDFRNLSTTTVTAKSWSLLDAARLVLEPLFGQSKKDLPYTEPGTPGFDAWDEVLTGIVIITFPQSGFEVYADVASDDNRGNLTDLKAHWDHTLGYQLGLTKNTKFNQYNIFAGAEFLTTRVSNTFNPSFYRGHPNTQNYYAKTPYDYFSYQGRLMGAHSGSSSDDLIFMLGLSDDSYTALMSYNKERHGIKIMPYPELKTEYVLTYHRKITPHHTAFITLEYEKIKNFGFIQNNISVSRLIWLGYSFSIN